MRKNFLQRLQKVKFCNLIHIFLFVAAILPAIILRIMRPGIWLVSETKDEARDNGYWFFKYVRENSPQRDIVYAINKHSADYRKVCKLGETVDYGSLKHWIYYLACQIKISSHKSGRPDDAICYVLDRIGLHKTSVFLQHGIIKDDLPYVHADNADFALFSTSVSREQKFVESCFGFKKGVVRQLGLCRFDDLDEGPSESRMILVMPTWRQWIASPDYGTVDAEHFERFEDTKYYKKWNGFLNSEAFGKMLEGKNLRAVFYPHRLMQKYIEYFQCNSERISICAFPEGDVHELLKKASILITDYSSVAMDFAYMGKPVIYYQFDYLKFRKYHLEEGYFDYIKDGFGPVCNSWEAICREVEYIEKSGFSQNSIYAKRAYSFFDLKDKNNCKRTYEAVKGLEVR